LTNKQSSHDQAEELRKQVTNLKQDKKELDVLSLPPRSEVHKNTNKKTKWKIKYPVIRLLAIFFILLPISILSIYYLYDKKPTSVVTLNQNDSYETINIDGGNNEQKTEPIQNDRPSQERDTEFLEAKPSSSDKKSISQQELNENEVEQSGEEVITHIVQENETLFSIAMKYYRDDEGMEIIKEWNHLNSSQLHKGQVLKIPVFEMSK
jgi:LysM repeat protein